MESEPGFDRDDVQTIQWLLTDILNELKEIRRLLEDEEEEEASE
jgi:hypothetical protein